jgi:CSLREA domain-containing protein
MLLLFFSTVGTPASNAAAFVVNSTSDSVDANPGDGICATGAGVCTVRAAIQEANALPGADTITIPAGVYTLRIATGAEDSAFGDFDITGPLTIVGAGQSDTILDGGLPPIGATPNVLAVDRLFEIYPTAGNVAISHLTIQGGWSAEDGGGIYNVSPGTLRLESVTVRDSFSEVEGGGIFHDAGRLIVTGTAAAPSLIADNTARGGGGIYSTGLMSPSGVTTRVEVSFTTFSGNSAEAAGGGVEVVGEGLLTIANSTFSDNHTAGDGGGVSAGSKSSLTLTNANFSNNSADGDGGGLASATEGQATITGGTFSGNSAGAEDEAGGGGMYLGGSGSIDVANVTVENNSATGEGGGIVIDNGGSVALADSAIRGNSAGASGGGIVNAGRTVTFTRLTITDNTAAGDGGGIESQSTGNFTITDTSVHSNIAASGGGFANAGDGTLRVTRTTFWDNRALASAVEDSGLGGGIYSLGDAAAEYTNVTIAGNLAQARAGGLYTDADAGIRVINSTIAFNSSPIGAGVADEGTNLNLPTPSTSVIFRNTIVAGNISGDGKQCNFALGSEGGNLENGDSCMFRGPNDRSNATTLDLDAVADNGGSTLTMALQPGSLAIDGGVLPCPSTDQRGVARPQNSRCDIGAFEYTGPFLPPDTAPPDTEFLAGPTQDTEATSIFRFTGLDVDNVTAPEDLIFECRLLEFDPAEPPEPVDPTQPPDPTTAFLACPNPWQVKVIEAGSFLFEVRAIDRAGNVDPTPASYQFTVELDLIPPETFLIETPTNPSGSTATFTFGAADNATPAQFLEFECRLDSNDPLAWLECSNPAVFSNLVSGSHTFQVRAADGGDNIDPSPATYTWEVGTPEDCDAANITLFAAEDSYVDEGLPLDTYGFFESLILRSAAPGNDARALVRFVIPSDLPDCELESATLRLYSSGDAGRSLEALTIADSWSENTVNWFNQPDTSGIPAIASSGEGYRNWNVTSQVGAMIAGTTPNYGFLIRDSAEEDAAGADQSFLSSEAVREPPTPPQLVLRFADEGTPSPAPPPDASGPTPLVCGQVITESVTLQNDLLGCMGEGLIIGAHNIVVDLNGRTVSSGMVIEPGEEDGLVAGIRNAGYDNVIIRNGTVRGFGFGVRLLPGATYNVVEGMTLFGNVNAGVELYDADNGRNGNIVRGNDFFENGAGVQIVFGSENSVVEDNYFLGNAGVALYMYDSSGHRIENNIVSGLTTNPLLDSDGGFYLEASSDNIIRGNELSDTGDAGILLTAGSNDNLIEGNSATRASDSAISLDDSDGNVVRNNIVHLAGGAGIGLGNANDSTIVNNDVRFNPGGIELAGSSGNLIEENDASETGSTGISAEGGESNIIRNNLANNNNAAGISVEAETLDVLGNPIGGFLIAGNQANNNLSDGISVGGSGHTITDNDAYNNAGFGIFAAEGNIDGGGNLASGNAEPLQCVGVVCSPGDGAPPPTTDLTPPDTVILTQPANGSSTASPTVFTFTGSDNNAPALALRFECRLDAPPDPPPPPPEPGEPPQPPDVDNWLECASPQSYSFLLAGDHTFEVRAVDPADNVDLTPAVYTWTAVAAPPGPDGVPPSTTITGGPTDPSTDTTATFTFTGSDNTTPGPNLAFECSLDGGAFTACTSPVTYTGLSLGLRTFAVRAVDLGGAADLTPAEFSWTINAPPDDTTPPNTTIDSGPELVTVNDSASFSFSSDEDDVTFECSLDGGPFAACTSPQEYTTLSVAVHTFQVRAIDAADNEDDSPAEYTWEVTPPPVPVVIGCGQVITESTLLLNSLANCLGDGLVIGANKITIDLGGNTIDGASVSESAGIRNDGYDDVTIINGTITEFDYGVLLNPGSTGNLVSGLDLQLNPLAGVSLLGAQNSTVRDNSFGGNGDSIQLLDGAANNLVRNNDIAGSVGLGLAIINASNNRLENNTIAGSGDQGIEMLGATFNRLTGNSISGASDTAFAIEEGSNDNIIEGNTVNGSEAGINMSGSHRNQLINNRVSGSSDNGISLEESNNNILRGNDLRFNTGGVQISDSLRNRIEANILSDITGNGLELGDGALQNVIIGNFANDNDADGIVIEGSAPPGEGNLIEGNFADGNASDGIAIAGVGHIILRNEANGNAGWGIYASGPSVEGFNIDGGYNSAQGNSEPAQCYNVTCTGGPAAPSDTTPPETVIESAPANPSIRTSASFTFSGSDNGSGVVFECRLTPLAATFSACASPISFIGLALGDYTFEVRAIDFLGNIDPTPASYAWTVEAAPPGVAPETFIDAGPDSATASTSATFVFSSNEEDVTFECALDGGAFVACSATATFTSLPVGLRTLEVRAIDVESIVDPTPASYSWTITAAPLAQTLSCGQLITQSTILSNNLTDCNGNGLVIGASNITLDLNGRTIDGINLGVGILNNGFDNVVITNGFIQEFDFAVQLNAGASGNVVSGLRTLSNQEGGIQLSNADQAGAGNIVRDNTIEGSIHGVALIDGSSASTVRNNTISAAADNGVYVLSSNDNRIEANTIFETSGAGVMLEGASGNTVLDNELTSNSGGGVVVGVELFPANNNRIEGNTIRLASGDGIAVVDSSQNELVNNDIRESSGGISLDNAQSTLILRNDIRSSSGGIDLIASSGNTIEDNTVSANSGGISLESLSLSNLIVRNTVTNNSGEGIYIADPAPAAQGNRIEFNTVSNNSGGIFVNAAAHTIRGNIADLNDGWGIYAVEGNIDGGGNAATGNAEPLQCFTIVCVIGAPPGAPDTTIVESPPLVTNSRDVYFTFTGVDNTTPTANLAFQCRLDSTSELAWVDCENPQFYNALNPGLHLFEVRAVDENEFVDPTPASYEWTYVALPSGVAPDTFIDLAPPLESPLLEGIFTFSSNEPSVTFECSLDGAPFTPCGFEGVEIPVDIGVFEFAFEEFELGLHNFRVRAIDFEGNIDPTPASYDWTIGGLLTTITNGPAYIPPAEPGELAEGGETEETTATFEFEANIADSTFFCAIDFGPYVECETGVTYTSLPIGEHVFQVYAVDPEGREQLEPTEYGWVVIGPLDTTPPLAQILTTPADNSSEVVFTFTGSDNLTVPAGLTFECSLDGVTFVECVSPFNLYTGFPDFQPGPATFYLQALDLESNISDPVSYSWTAVADTVAPVVLFQSIPPTLTIALEATFSFNASDNTTPLEMLLIECSLDGVLFEPCESPTTVDVEPGPQTFLVRATDLSANVSTLASYSWEVVGPPVTTIVSGPAAATTDTTATFVFSASQSPVTYECSLNGSPFVSCVTPFTLENLGGGSYELAVQATNSYGLVEEIPVTYTWAVTAGADTTPPDTTITANPPASTASAAATFAFTSNELNVSFQCQLSRDGVVQIPFTGCETPTMLEGLLGGVYTFEVQAVDATGNIDPTPAGYTWTVLGPPTTTLVSVPLDPTESRDATFEFASNVPGSTFECWLDGVVVGACDSGSITFTDLAYGDHEFLVYATAPGGYVDTIGAEYQWSILDIQTTLTAAPPAVTTETGATFNFTASVDGSTFECSLDGAPFTTCTGPISYSGLSVDTHTFQVQATSPAGNLDASPASYTWEIEPVIPPDVTPPTTSLIVTPAATTTSAEATFTFSASELNVTFECALDAAASADPVTFGGCISPVVYNGLEPGFYTFLVRATDLAGNVGATVSFTWEILNLATDTTPPDTTITDGPEGENGNLTVEFFFTGSDNATPPELLEFECSTDGGVTFEACSSPETLADLALGPQSFQVRAVDLAGNVDPSPATREWTVVDLIAPETSLDVTPEDVTEATIASFTFSSDDPTATFECSLDGADYAACVSGDSFGGLSTGSHTFQVSAVDPAGNRDATPDSFQWVVVAATAPVASISAGPGATIDTATPATFGFTADQPAITLDGFECSLNSGPFESCDNPYELADLTPGSYTLAVRAVDLLGKVGPASAEYAWTVVPFVDPELNNTPTGSNVGVLLETPTGEALITFASVTAAGNTSVVDATSAPALPANFEAGASTYEITTTATFSGLISICLPYDSNQYPNPNDVRLLHFEGGSWVDVTSSVNVTAEQVCGNVTSLSPFAVSMETEEPTSTPTNTPEPTATPTNTPEPTATPTNTPEPTATPTDTPTNTPGPTATPTNTPEPTATPTNTSTPTATSTNTPAPISCTATPVTVAANADAWLEQNSPTSNKGSDSVLKVKSQGSTDNFRAIIRFNTPATLPSGCIIESATLRLYAESSVSGRTLQALRVIGNWTEGGVTWNNQPATNGSTATTSSGSGYREWNVTSHLTADYAAGTHYGFLIRDANENGNGSEQAFRPRGTGSNRPQLVIRYTSAGPAPTATPTNTSVLPTATPTNTAVPPTATPTNTTTPADTTPPDTLFTLSGMPPNPSSDSSASFSFTGNDNQTEAAALEFECSLDEAPFADCVSPHQVVGLNPGSHTFAVQAVDAAGNTDPSPLEYTWMIELAPTATATTAPTSTPVPADTTTPETTLDTWPSATTTSTSATFTFSANEAGSIFECALDDGQFSLCSSGITYPNLTIGGHVFSVRAIDAAGNVEATPAMYAWTIEEAATATPVPSATATATTVPPTATATATLVPPTATATHTPVPTNTPTATPMAACTTTTVTVGANADAWLDQGSTGNNYGSDSILKVQAKSGGNFRALVRFDMPASIPQGCVIQSASLRLYATSWKNNRTLQAWQVNASWTEGGVKWNNQPATTGSAVTTNSGSGWRQWNVTSQVQAMYNAGVNNGFLIRDANEGGNGSEQQFHSREKGESMPQLVISFAPAPTPTPAPTATHTPVPTPTNTPAATSTPVPMATSTPAATGTPVPTATNTPEPTATDTPEPTATNTPEPTPTDTPVPPTDTPEPTATSAPTDTPEPPPSTDTPTATP